MSKKKEDPVSFTEENIMRELDSLSDAELRSVHSRLFDSEHKVKTAFSWLTDEEKAIYNKFYGEVKEIRATYSNEDEFEAHSDQIMRDLTTKIPEIESVMDRLAHFEEILENNSGNINQ
ncbi:TPA: hypothetical protein DIV55_06950 [Patescibacteria group bacterium]|uniref:Uncharacterized protein n=1 Tax=Candidatus Gottesmanbacteria bacterium GW2011_GWA1_43_11 TaxID=1618436 RepID=A0A0G1FC53_9BACT|nr:MAG: hypothetical protein UV59_C0019G0018 [Candidatus Gottesmanbacteria bacterium GW2011_GWA1_43_11]HCS79442.1 hypothetical protein [Patescibacteria group bacterium]